MINRIVCLSFQPEKVEQFLSVFEATKQRIAAFPGCQGLKLLRDVNNINVFFTYSLWDEAASLEAYRHSELFKETWAQTKILFNEKPQAWSTEVADAVK